MCSVVVSLKVIRFDPLAPVQATVLLLCMEWKMPDFINNIEKFKPNCKKLASTFIEASEKLILDNFDSLLFYYGKKSCFRRC